MAAYGEASSRSAFTFMPPVTRDSVSRPDRSVTCCGRRITGETGPGQSLTRVDSLPANARNTPINQPTNHACTYHEGVVKGREDVRHAEDVLALRGLGAEVQGLRVVDRLGSSPLGLMDCGFEGMGLDGDEICGLTGGWTQARPDPPTSSSGVIDLPHTYASIHPFIDPSRDRGRTILMRRRRKPLPVRVGCAGTDGKKCESHGIGVG